MSIHLYQVMIILISILFLGYFMISHAQFHDFKLKQATERDRTLTTHKENMKLVEENKKLRVEISDLKNSSENIELKNFLHDMLAGKSLIEVKRIAPSSVFIKRPTE